ncbi:hypothetical protein Ancab_039118 [Ancistrocladus abbreviatus]
MAQRWVDLGFQKHADHRQHDSGYHSVREPSLRCRSADVNNLSFKDALKRDSQTNPLRSPKGTSHMPPIDPKPGNLDHGYLIYADPFLDNIVLD